MDTDAIVSAIRQRVEEKQERGEYSDPVLSRAERYNLGNLKDADSFLPYYLSCLRDTTEVDINDFEIVERRKFVSAPLVLAKKVLWKALKFYTYRLWTQQNQVNSLLLGALEGLQEHYSERIEQLEKRINELEKADGAG